jgi:GxxExxY protein
MADIIYENESYQIVKACMTVHNELGCGFLEAVYHEALALEFENISIPFEKEKALVIYYKGKKLQKNYIADFVCYGRIILELKALGRISIEHESQVLNYLKISGFKLGIITNFGQRSFKYKRIVF